MCDVNRGLLSVRKVTKSGNKMVFDEDGSYIQNKATGEITMLKEKAGCTRSSCGSKGRIFSGRAGWI